MVGIKTSVIDEYWNAEFGMYAIPLGIVMYDFPPQDDKLIQGKYMVGDAVGIEDGNKIKGREEEK